MRRAARAHPPPGEPGGLLAHGHAARAGARVATQWMDELRQFERGEMALMIHDSADGVAQRPYTALNPRLTPPQGRLAGPPRRRCARALYIMGDAAHKIVNP